MKIPIDAPLFPLPEDYETLTEEGKRLARINALTQWFFYQNTPHAAKALIASTKALDDWYLKPDPEAGFDPGFYPFDPLPTPSFHWLMTRQWAIHRFSITIAPRGSAKSTQTRKDIILRLLTVPRYSIIYSTSALRNIKETSAIIREQIYENERIIRDFGNLKPPPKSTKLTGVEHFYTNHGSHCQLVSTRSTIRGLRAHKFKLDDPEYDPASSTSMQDLTQTLDTFLTKVVIPTVTQPGCSLDWLATLISRRHLCYKAVTVGEDGRSTDPRFDHWGRLIIPAAYEDEDGNLQSIWPELWPNSIEDEQPGQFSLERLRQVIGSNAFASEYMATPGIGDDRFFHLDEHPRGRNAYWFEQTDEALSSNPRVSNSLICFIDPTTDTPTRLRLSSFLGECDLFITIDTAYTESAHADRKVCTQLAYHRYTNLLFVLDMDSGRFPESTLIQKAIRMAARWGCHVLCPEVVRESHRLATRLDEILKTRTPEVWGLDPGSIYVRPIRPGFREKTGKIAALDVRVEYGLLKLPLDRMTQSNTPLGRLLTQFQEFSPILRDGGLAHDDEIDSVAMHTYVLKQRLSRPPVPDPKRPEIDLEEAFEAGQRTYSTGEPLLAGLDPRHIPPSILSTILDDPPSEAIQL